MAKLDFEKLNSMQRYTQWVIFQVRPGALPSDRGQLIDQAQQFFDGLEDEGDLIVRGLYDITGTRADADMMVWWHAEEFETLQRALQRFRRETALGQALEVHWIGNGLHRPAEFNKSHLPSFIMDEEPGAWITLYPFVRSYDWYIMEEQKRRKILSEHGQAARDFPDVRANTVPAFALGDYEWMLAFEAPSPDRIVDLMYTMRYTEARLHVREEVPFFSGRRVANVAELVNALV